MDLKEIAEKGKQIEEEIGINIDDILNKLTQEVGELNDAIQKHRGIYCRSREEDLEHIKEEFGDVFFNLISLCYRIGLNPEDLSKYAEITLEKFEKRKKNYLEVRQNKK